MRTTQKQKGLAHCWKAHGAGHIPLCGIFQSRILFYNKNGDVCKKLELNILKIDQDKAILSSKKKT